MQPNEKELKAIKFAEDLLAQNEHKGLKSMFRKKFHFPSKDVYGEKNLSLLWEKYGLTKNNSEHNFSEDEKLNCISEWVRILYPFEVDVHRLYAIDKNDFEQKARKFYQEHPHMHVSWDFPSPEKFLKKLDNTLGNYDNPKCSKEEVNDEELFEIGIDYVRRKIKADGYQIEFYQKPPFVPQMVLMRNGKKYFLYFKVDRHPVPINKLFSHIEMEGYANYCQKHSAGFLLSGIIFSNMVDENIPIYKEDKIGVDFTGILDMFN